MIGLYAWFQSTIQSINHLREGYFGANHRPTATSAERLLSFSPVSKAQSVLNVGDSPRGLDDQTHRRSCELNALCLDRYDPGTVRFPPFPFRFHTIFWSRFKFKNILALICSLPLPILKHQHPRDGRLSKAFDPPFTLPGLDLGSISKKATKRKKVVALEDEDPREEAQVPLIVD